MSAGTPVVASRGGSVPEIVGDAGLLVDPDDIDAWAEAMTRIAQDEPLRDELRRRGAAQAAAFTWDRTARETVAVYDSVAS
jgi:glycosyltransferase involved in cell wall biosynthesis